MPLGRVGLGQIGLQLQGSAATSQSLVVLSLGPQGNGEVDVCRGIVGFKIQRSTATHVGTVGFSLGQQDHAEVIVSLGKAWLEFQNSAVAGRGLLQSPLRFPEVTEISQCRGVVRLSRNAC